MIVKKKSTFVPIRDNPLWLCAHTVAWIQLHRAVREITESWMGGDRAHKMAERES